MNAEQVKEIRPVILGAMAAAFAFADWHSGSDKETMAGAVRFLFNFYYCSKCVLFVFFVSCEICTRDVCEMPARCAQMMF